MTVLIGPKFKVWVFSSMAFFVIFAAGSFKTENVNPNADII